MNLPGPGDEPRRRELKKDPIYDVYADISLSPRGIDATGGIRGTSARISAVLTIVVVGLFATVLMGYFDAPYYGFVVIGALVLASLVIIVLFGGNAGKSDGETHSSQSRSASEGS